MAIRHSSFQLEQFLLLRICGHTCSDKIHWLAGENHVYCTTIAIVLCIELFYKNNCFMDDRPLINNHISHLICRLFYFPAMDNLSFHGCFFCQPSGDRCLLPPHFTNTRQWQIYFLVFITGPPLLQANWFFVYYPYLFLLDDNIYEKEPG